jgi:hypothetical protein
MSDASLVIANHVAYHLRQIVRNKHDVSSSFAAVPDWDHERPAPQVRCGDAPGYNDPSKFGGSTAPPVRN